jgi:hypothetical protein
MALSVTEANAISAEGSFDKTLTKVVYEDCALYKKLESEGKVIQDGGRDIRWSVRYKELDKTDWVNPREAIDYTAVETRTEAVLDWKYVLGRTLLSWDERVKNGGSKYQKVNIVKDKTAELKEDYYKKFAVALFASTQATDAMASLHTIVDATTSYAGIAVADVAAWAATESTEATFSLYAASGISLSLADAVSAATFGKNAPNFHYTTRSLQNIFESKMVTYTRYEDVTMANMGFRNVTFKGAPVIGDAFCTASHWFGLDTSVLEFHVHPDFDGKLTEWEELGQAGLPNAMYKVMSGSLNLISKRRDTHFKFTALAG